MILYFSATGNSKYVAERIAAAFDDTERKRINTCDNGSRFRM